MNEFSDVDPRTKQGELQRPGSRRMQSGTSKEGLALLRNIFAIISKVHLLVKEFGGWVRDVGSSVEDAKEGVSKLNDTLKMSRTILRI